MTGSEPIKITKRDLEMIQYQRDLLRRANLTSPQMSLQGPDMPLIRSLALETFMQMKAASPEAFRDRTVADWEQALKEYITTRRPEFREELLRSIREKYSSGAIPPREVSALLMGEASKGLSKESAFLWEALNRALNEVTR